jgi:hypothetical protein
MCVPEEQMHFNIHLHAARLLVCFEPGAEAPGYQYIVPTGTLIFYHSQKEISSSATPLMKTAWIQIGVLSNPVRGNILIARGFNPEVN